MATFGNAMKEGNKYLHSILKYFSGIGWRD
jgi:hypothetical protein